MLPIHCHLIFFLQVDSLRTQADEQEETLKVKEGDVNEKLSEYNGMNEEEASIESGMKESQETIEKLTVSLQDTQLAIVQVDILAHSCLLSVSYYRWLHADPPFFLSRQRLKSVTWQNWKKRWKT